MLRNLSIFFLMLALLPGVLAFTITDSQDQERTYFSIPFPQVFVETEENHSSFTVYYDILGNEEEETYDLTPCSSNFCGEFVLTELFEDFNNTLVSSKSFTISIGNTNKTIQFDLENPSFTLLSATVDADNQELDLTFSYTDNSGEVDKVELFKREGSNLFSIATFTLNETSYSYPLNSSEDLTLVFKAIDIAGNSVEVEESVTISDIFLPTISQTRIIKKDDGFELFFTAKDDNLDTYELTQNNLTLTGVISGNEFSTTLDLPFSSGEVVLKVIDVGDNEATYTFSLTSTGITAEVDPQVTNQQQVGLTSNAQTCIIVRVEEGFYDDVMTKSGNRFSFNAPFDGQGDQTFEVYCDLNDKREYFVLETTYDTIQPEKSNVTLRAESDGSVEIEWTTAKDSSGILRYELYRDGKEVYSGTRKDFKDKITKYPNEYEYFVRAFDKAGNSIDSEEKTIVPKKVDIEFDINLDETQTVQNDFYQLTLDVDEVVDVQVTVRNNGIILNSTSFSDVEDLVRLDLFLEDGTNTVEVELEDAFGNTKQETYFVSYNAPVLSVPDQQEPVTQTQQEPAVNETQDDTNKDENPFVFPWKLLLLIVFFILLFVFIRIIKGGRSTYSSKKRDLFSFHRSKDHMLNRDLDRIKSARVKRQQERALKHQRAEKKKDQERKRTALEKRKLKDLEEKRMFEIPHEKRERAKKRVQKIRKEVGKEEFDEGIRESAHSRIAAKKKNNEGFDHYLKGTQQKASWHSPKEYRSPKEQPQPEVKEPQPNPHHSKKGPFPPEKEHPQKEEPEQPKRQPKKRLELDEYLQSKSKYRKKFFAQRDVDRDLRRRSR